MDPEILILLTAVFILAVVLLGGISYIKFLSKDFDEKSTCNKGYRSFIISDEDFF